MNYADLGHVQGHLAVHFRLEDQSVAAVINPADKFVLAFAEAFSVFGEPKKPRTRRLLYRKKRDTKRVLDENAREVLQRHNRSDGENLMPLKGARSMLPDQARRHWRSLIPNPGRRWEKRRRRRTRRSPS